MSSFFVHKKHASKHKIVAHRCHVILVGFFGRKPNVMTARRPVLFGGLRRLWIERHGPSGIGRRWHRAKRAVEVQPFGQMVRHQSYWLKIVIVPGNDNGNDLQCSCDTHGMSNDWSRASTRVSHGGQACTPDLPF